jgi:hypothetical protein
LRTGQLRKKRRGPEQEDEGLYLVHLPLVRAPALPLLVLIEEPEVADPEQLALSVPVARFTRHPHLLSRYPFNLHAA